MAFESYRCAFQIGKCKRIIKIGFKFGYLPFLPLPFALNHVCAFDLTITLLDLEFVFYFIQATATKAGNPEL